MAGVLIVSDPAAHAALKSVFAAGAAALCCASAGEARRALLGVIGVLQSALRDAIFAGKGLPQPPVVAALRAQTQALASAVSAARLLELYDFLSVLTDRVSRNAAAAAVTNALTSDAYRICFL